MIADARTIAVYDAKADSYADRFRTEQPGRYLQAFMEGLPADALVLDLGCGPGNSSAFLRAAGFAVDPVDASSAMVALANQRHEIAARIATFDDMDATDTYDGVWANFSLLHAPRTDLPRHLAALHRALKPQGLFHLAMKTGSGEGRDGIDRFYTYYAIDELQAVLDNAGFRVIAVEEGWDVGLAGTNDPFAVLRAHA